MLKINIKVIDGNTHELMYDKDDKIKQLKKYIIDKQLAKIDDKIIIMRNGKQFKDDVIIKDISLPSTQDYLLVLISNIKKHKQNNIQQQNVQPQQNIQQYQNKQHQQNQQIEEQQVKQTQTEKIQQHDEKQQIILTPYYHTLENMGYTNEQINNAMEDLQKKQQLNGNKQNIKVNLIQQQQHLNYYNQLDQLAPYIFQQKQIFDQDPELFKKQYLPEILQIIKQSNPINGDFFEKNPDQFLNLYFQCFQKKSEQNNTIFQVDEQYIKQIQKNNKLNKQQNITNFKQQ